MSLPYFHILPVLTDVAVKMGVQISLQHTVIIFFRYIPRSGFLDHIIATFFNFWGISTLFSIMVVPVYIPSNSVQGFLFLHILNNTITSLFDNSHPNRCEVIRYCDFDLLSLIISDVKHLFITCWPFVCLFLGKLSIQVFRPFFFFFNFILFLTLHNCISFAKYQNESATGIHVFPILNPPPSSLPIPSLWVVPMHQSQASSIVHRTWTGNSFHTWYYTCFNAILPNLPNLSLSHRVHKTVLCISVSFSVSYTGLLLPSF